MRVTTVDNCMDALYVVAQQDISSRTFSSERYPPNEFKGSAKFLLNTTAGNDAFSGNCDTNNDDVIIAVI